MLRMGELFAGYGGLGMGVARALGGDVETAWVSEFDPAPSKILARHWPDAPNLGDVTRVDWSRVEPVDVLTGGFPCQDVSLAGRRAGMRDGTRSGLWSHMRAAIDALRPGLVVIENVRGLLSAQAGGGHDLERCGWCVGDGGGVPLRALGAVLGDLADLGFDAEWGGVEASRVGAPHRRYRVFIVAWPADAYGDLWGRFGRGASAEEAGPDAGHGSADSGRGGRPELSLFRTPMADEDGGGPLHPDAARERGQTLRLTGQVLAMTGDLPSPSGASPASGGGAAAEDGFGEFAPAVARWEAVLGRPAPAPTEPSPRGGRPRLAPAFVEWMMGLPAGHVTKSGLSRTEALKALGNGVVPQQASVAVRELLYRVIYKTATAA